MVFPNSSENLIFSKPQLDDLGFSSTKFEIELGAYGVSFPAIVPEDFPWMHRVRGHCDYWITIPSVPEGNSGPLNGSDLRISPSSGMISGGWSLDLMFLMDCS